MTIKNTAILPVLLDAYGQINIYESLNNTNYAGELRIYVHLAIFELQQIGVPFTKTTVNILTDEFKDIIPDNCPNPSAVIAYIMLYCRLFFDPPSTSFVLESFNRQKEALLWRILASADEVNYDAEYTSH